LDAQAWKNLKGLAAANIQLSLNNEQFIAEK
jgi:hypothetical protein